MREESENKMKSESKKVKNVRKRKEDLAFLIGTIG